MPNPFLLLHRSSPVVNRDALNLLAQVSVQVADEGLQHLPLVVLHLALNLGYQQTAGRLVPLNPAGVLDVLPAPIPHPPERRVRPPQGPLRGLQDGFQLRVDPGLGDHLQDFHVGTFLLRGGRLGPGTREARAGANTGPTAAHRTPSAGIASTREPVAWPAPN